MCACFCLPAELSPSPRMKKVLGVWEMPMLGIESVKLPLKNSWKGAGILGNGQPWNGSSKSGFKNQLKRYKDLILGNAHSLEWEIYNWL